MSRQNKINFVEAVYKNNPSIEDRFLAATVQNVFGGIAPSLKTISVWKARLRKKGVLIPDKRLKQTVVKLRVDSEE